MFYFSYSPLAWQSTLLFLTAALPLFFQKISRVSQVKKKLRITEVMQWRNRLKKLISNPTSLCKLPLNLKLNLFGYLPCVLSLGRGTWP